jgi:hypothetical protein
LIAHKLYNIICEGVPIICADVPNRCLVGTNGDIDSQIQKNECLYYPDGECAMTTSSGEFLPPKSKLNAFQHYFQKLNSSSFLAFGL